MSRDAREVRLGGTVFRVADDKPTFWDRAEAGTWEPGTLAALVPLLGPDMTFLDCGAWVGPLTLLAAAQGARVVAVEADPTALDQLRRNLAVNPELSARIEIVAGAISPMTGTVRLGARRKPGDSMSSALLAETGQSWTTEAVTPAMLADTLRDIRHLVVKIDIEGGEYALLPHLGPLLRVADTVVLVSFHPVILAEAGIADVAGLTREATLPFAGWRAFAITPTGPEDRGVLPEVDLLVADIDTWLFRRA